MKYEIELPEADLKQLKEITEARKQLYELYKTSAEGTNYTKTNKLFEAIRNCDTDIHQILLKAIFNNKAWQKEVGIEVE